MTSDEHAGDNNRKGNETKVEEKEDKSIDMTKSC